MKWYPLSWNVRHSKKGIFTDTIRIWEAFICEWYISLRMWKGLKDQIDKFASDLWHNVWVFHYENKLHQVSLFVIWESGVLMHSLILFCMFWPQPFMCVSQDAMTSYNFSNRLCFLTIFRWCQYFFKIYPTTLWHFIMSHDTLTFYNLSQDNVTFYTFCCELVP